MDQNTIICESHSSFKGLIYVNFSFLNETIQDSTSSYPNQVYNTNETLQCSSTNEIVECVTTGETVQSYSLNQTGKLACNTFEPVCCDTKGETAQNNTPNKAVQFVRTGETINSASSKAVKSNILNEAVQRARKEKPTAATDETVKNVSNSETILSTCEIVNDVCTVPLPRFEKTCLNTQPTDPVKTPSHSITEMSSTQDGAYLDKNDTSVYIKVLPGGLSKPLECQQKSMCVNRIFKCYACSETFFSNEDRIAHVISHFKHITPYRCGICKLFFVGSNVLQKHIIDLHVNSVRKRKCRICNKIFTNKLDLLIHSQIHPFTAKKLAFLCKVCNKNFSTASKLSTHMIGHTGEHPYKCRMCSATFFTKGNLKVHTIVHTRDQPYKCNVCKRLFSGLFSLWRHKKTHTGDKLYRCAKCDATFIQQKNLKIHTLKHFDEQRFICEVCGAGFSVNESLVRHLLKHQNESQQT